MHDPPSPTTPSHRVALTLVCHRWNEVLCSPCAAPLWRTFCLAEQQWRPMDVDALYVAKHRLLQAVAPAVHTLEFRRGSVELAEKSCTTVPQFLAACNPAVLRCIMLRCQEPPPRRVLTVLRIFPSAARAGAAWGSPAAVGTGCAAAPAATALVGRFY